MVETANTAEPFAAKNTDRELWRETEGDFYAPSIHVTESGSIGMNVGGSVVVMPIYEWHALAFAADKAALAAARDAALEEAAGIAEVHGAFAAATAIRAAKGGE